jgi:hypothetical protein
MLIEEFHVINQKIIKEEIKMVKDKKKLRKKYVLIENKTS